MFVGSYRCAGGPKTAIVAFYSNVSVFILGQLKIVLWIVELEVSPLLS